MRLHIRRLLAAATLALIIAPVSGASASATGPTVHRAASLLAFGSITEFPLPDTSNTPEDITAGPDGNLWFTLNSGNRIGRISPTGVITLCAQFSGVSRGLGGITTGPDGNLWATESQGNAIAEFTPACVLVNEFPVPTASSGPDWIAAGPDGNLWFTEYFGDNVAKISTAGVITEVKSLPSGSGPSGITNDVYGYLWFVEQKRNVLGRLSPTGGTFQEFDSLTGTTPSDIAPGPDGNLWFPEFDGNKIGKITPVGGVTEYSSGLTGSSQPGNIATGPDGNVWFTQEASDQIGRITPSGTITEFGGMTSGAGPGGITVGPDGNMWFTERSKGKIGRLTTASPGVSYVLHHASGFTPQSVTVNQGSMVQWIFLGPIPATVTDTSGMGLFDSGPRPFVTYFSVTFPDAGSYAYRDTSSPTHTGMIKVRIKASPKSGTSSTTFIITWAAAPAATGFVFDIQIERPGSTSFVNWTTGQTAPSATFIADAGVGVYKFRSRLHKASRHSGYSPTVTITVT